MSPRLAPLLAVAALAVVAVVLAACPAEKTPVAEKAADAGVATASAPKRPPFPNMATAAWGQRVLEERVHKSPANGAKATATTVLDALHDLSPGSEQKAAELATVWYQTATGDADRADAVALLAVALVLDPSTSDYKERLIDAYGLASYAGTIDSSSAVGQSARVVVGASAGAVENARRLLQVVETTPGLNPEARIFMALGQKLTGGKFDAAFDDVSKALAARPNSGRAHAFVAEMYLDAGLYPEAVKAATVEGGAGHPWLDTVRGRALVLDGGKGVDDGIALLKASQEKLDEGRRGDALYWLGRSLTQKPDSAAEIDQIVATLSQRPGFAKESAALSALASINKGDYAKARAALEPHVKGAPILPVDADIAWELADTCAALGDTVCVDKAAARAVSIDGDYARLHNARAAVGLVGKAANVDAHAALVEAFRASPFDPQLAKKVGEAVVDGGTVAANRVRAARRAVTRKSPLLVGIALAPLAKNAQCRVCRALTAMGSSGVEAVQNAIKAQDGAGPPLCVADLVGVINALGAAPTDDAKKALDKITDKREPIVRAIERARADHQQPDARRRRDAGERPEDPQEGHAPPRPSLPGVPGAPGAPISPAPRGPAPAPAPTAPTAPTTPTTPTTPGGAK